MTEPGKSFGQLGHINRQIWASNNCDGDGKLPACRCKKGCKPPRRYLGWSHHAAEPCGCSYSPCCSLPAPTRGKPPPSAWLMGTGQRNRYTAAWPTCKEHFPWLGDHRAPDRWKYSHQSLRESTESHSLHKGSFWQLPRTGTDCWMPAVWGSEPAAYAACGKGSGMRRGGKAGRQPLSPLARQAAGAAGCLGGPSPSSIPMGRQPQGAESGTCDGPAPWLTLPNQPGTPAALGSQHGIPSSNYYSQNWSESHCNTKRWSGEMALLSKTHFISSRARYLPSPFARQRQISLESLIYTATN